MQGARLPGEVVALHPHRQRAAVGVIGGVALAGFLVHHADLVPGGGDRTGLAQRFEAIASFGEGSHCVGKAALQQPNGTQLALVDSD